jgi:26S proteasome regulatory subunit N1
MSNYAAESTEQKKLLEIVFELYTKYNELANALRVAIKLKEKMYITSTLLACKNKSTKVQMAFILARSNYYVETTEIEPEISDIMKNLKSSEIFRNLTRALDITAPKHPEEIFKSHLEDKKEGAGAQLESYKINMSTSLVSGFINAGFGKEKLLSEKDNLGNDWLSKNKDEGLLCALASLGLVNIWDIECGPNEIEKFMDVNENNPFKRGGYNLGLGIISSGVVDENNTALALLSEQTKDKK